jgi:two-component system, NarL family, sensor kinase
MKKYFVLLILVCVWYKGLAQKDGIEQLNLDSLIQSRSADTVKIDYALEYSLFYLSKDNGAFKRSLAIADRYLLQNPSYIYGKALRYYVCMNQTIKASFDKALPYSDSIIALIKPFQNPKCIDLQIKTWIDKGYILSFMANDEASIKSYQMAIDLAKKYKQYKKAAMAFNNIGAIYANKEEYKEQIRLVREAIYYVSIPDADGKVYSDKLAFFYLTISGAFSALEQLDSADFYLNKASSIVLKEKVNPDLLIYYYLSLGNLEASKSHTKASTDQYKNALDIARANNNSNRILQLTVSIGNNYFEQKQYKDAISYFKESENYSVNLNNSAQLKEVYKILYDCYKKVSDKENAYYYLDKYFLLLDSLKIEENTEEFAELEKKYSLKLKDQELSYFKELNTANEKAIYQNKLIILALAGLILLGFLFAFIYLKQQKLVRIKDSEIAQLKISETESLASIERSKAILQTQEDERTRIAKDLHDEVGGTLAALKLKLQNNDLNVNNHSAVDIVDQLAKSVRQISHNMMPDAIEKFGLKNALVGYISKLNMQSDTAFKFQMEELEHIKFSESREIAIYRIVQEILTNALKHAKAKVVYIQMYESEGELYISIEDDGIGFEMKEITEGIGLKNIRSRVNFLSGYLEYQSQVNKGTSIQINIPIA